MRKALWQTARYGIISWLTIGRGNHDAHITGQRFFGLFQTGQFQLVTSSLVADEVIRAPEHVQDFYDQWLHFAEIIKVDNVDAVRLARAYLDAGIITMKYHGDSMHVAYATIAGCQLIVSWNFRHIVNYYKVPRYNAINVLHGYGPIAIYSPLEVATNEEEDV